MKSREDEWKVDEEKSSRKIVILTKPVEEYEYNVRFDNTSSLRVFNFWISYHEDFYVLRSSYSGGMKAYYGNAFTLKKKEMSLRDLEWFETEFKEQLKDYNHFLIMARSDKKYRKTIPEREDIWASLTINCLDLRRKLV